MYSYVRDPYKKPLALIAFAILLASCSSAFALDPSLDVNQYAHTAWKVRDGFARGLIGSVAQTQDGYLWLGTEFGLLRFDGVRAVSWQPPGNQHLPPGTVRSLLVSRDGTLWIGAKGLASWSNGKLTEYPQLVDQFVFALLEDHEGTVWVGTAGSPVGQLCAIQSGNIHCSGSDGIFGRFVNALYEDSDHSFWVAVKDGLWKWRPGPPKFYSLPGEPDGIQAVVEDADGAHLVGWKGGIYRFVDGKTQPYPLPAFTRKFAARKILRDRDGDLWVGTFQDGLLHVHQGRTDVFAQPNGLSGDTVYDVREDREGDIWIATMNGLDRFHDLSATTFTAKQGLSNDLVGSLLADKDGQLWFATYGGLNRWKHGRIVIPPTGSARLDGKLNGSAPNSLFQDSRGRIWVSTPAAFGYLENDRFVPFPALPGGAVLSMAQDVAGNLWVANERSGLFRLSPGNGVRQIPWPQLGHNDHASVLAADRKQGGLWIGFFLGGIAYFADGQVRASFTAADGLGAGRVSDFKLDDDGILWISTEGGLSRLKNGRVATLTSKNGLPCDTVHWAVEDDDHSYWLYMACGLIRIVRSEMTTWAAAADKDQDRNVDVRFTPFDISDGVKSLSSPGHFHPQVAKTPDGKIWFLPWDGVSVIDPHRLAFNKIPPPVHVEQITADGKTYDLSHGLRLPPLARDLQIDYTALSFVAPEKVLFRYKLEGFDQDWQQAGNRRQAFYTNLPPRNYHFRVIACNNSGVWNEAGTFLDFSVASAYYQTLWFKSLCVLVFLAFLWSLYQLRHRQLQQQFNIREHTLRHAIDAIPALAWCNLPDGPNEYLNKGWHEYTGLSAEESNGWGWQVAFHPEDLPQLMEKWRKMLASGEPGEIEARLRRHDGVYHWFLIRAEPFRDETGKIIRWYGTSTDIDDRKRSEEELRRSEAFLAESQRLSLTGSFSWKSATGEIVWSEQLYRIYELEIGMPLTLELVRTRVHPEDLTLYEKMVAEAQIGGRDFEWQYRLMMPDHSIKHLQAVAHAIRDQDGRLEYIAAIQDVTTRRTSEEALDKARSELAQVARVMSLGALTASIAHEVNQPLSGIVTNASTCLRMLSANPPNVDGARETARRTIRDGNRASDVITHLRALFTRKDPSVEIVDLNDAVQEVIALSISDLQRDRVALRADLAPDLPYITGDRVQLQQVILNLLRNASDAMRTISDRPKELLIRTERSGDQVCLCVKDVGTGFDPQAIDKLFHAFYTTKNTGMGIGLSVSRSIIENHHGRLWAALNEGPGATFSFSIPCKSDISGAN